MHRTNIFKETGSKIINSEIPDKKAARKEALKWLSKEELIELIVYLETNTESSMRALTFFNTKIFTRKMESLQFQTINQLQISMTPCDLKEELVQNNPKKK